MKKFTLLFYFSFFLFHSSFSQGVWTWVHGDSISNTQVLGVQGVPSPLNTPPGSYEAADWTDLQGNFWLMSNHPYADMWKYTPATNEWTWMKGTGITGTPGVYGAKGVPASSNQPPVRLWTSATWTDLNGDLWLYSGFGTGAIGELCDMWKFNIATNTWTWMSGKAKPTSNAPVYGTKGVAAAVNTPGGRAETCATWTDVNGNLWLFGGGRYLDTYNDLWKYNTVTNRWSWMNGSNLPNQPAVYGTRGVSSPLNTPGARFAYTTWKDLNGDFWLFGGSYPYSINDMWRYTVATNEWTWMGGRTVTGDSGRYGSLCVTDSTNLPACRFETRARWTDDCGWLWLYGGFTYYNSGYCGNDLWCFNPSTLQWTLVNGGSTPNLSPVYGTKGITKATNQPGGRAGTVAWKAQNGEVYLFGGYVPNATRRNDLWKFQPDPACPAGGSAALFNLGNDTSFCGSFTKTLTTHYPGTQWSTGATGSQITIATSGKYWASINTCTGVVSDTIVISTSAGPAAGNISSDNDSICGGTSLTSTFTLSGSTGSIQWQESFDSISFKDIPGATNITFTSPPGLLQTMYYRAIASRGGCLPDTSFIIVLHVIPSPFVTFTNILNGKTVIYKSFASGGVTSYGWDFGDSTTSNLQDPTHTYSRADTFHVCLTVYNSSNCSFTFCKDVITSVRTEANGPDQSSVKIYPNPVGDKLIIENYAASTRDIELTDVLGRVLITQQLPSQTQHTAIDVSRLIPGVYFIRLHSSDGTLVRKVVKE